MDMDRDRLLDYIKTEIENMTDVEIINLRDGFLLWQFDQQDKQGHQ